MKKLILVSYLYFSLTEVVLSSEYVACSQTEKDSQTCFDCGATCAARYTETTDSDGMLKGTLTISGQGEMSFEGKYPLNTVLEHSSGTYTYNGYYHYDLTEQRWRTDAPWQDLDTHITNVVIEDGITSIASGSFYNVSSLQSVSIPDSVTKIENAAFQHDSNLTSASLPPNLEQIGHAAFHNTNIEYFTLPEGLIADDTHMFSSKSLKGIFIEGNTDFQKQTMTGVNFNNLEVVYCEQSNESCKALKNDMDLTNKILLYEKQGGVYIFEDENGNQKFYLSGMDMLTKTNQCEKNLNECKRDVLENRNICQGKACDVLIQSDGKYMLKFNGKTYQSINDLLKGHYDVRRIYTLEEANFATGKVNRVSIRYK